MIPYAVEIPTLETERLVLRAPLPRDEAGYVDFFASERARYVGGNGTRYRAWQAFATEIGHWVIRGFGMWAVTLRGHDEAVGFVGCWEPGGWPEHEIGWLVYENAEGKGIAYEAALKARSHAYTAFGWDDAVSYIDHGNDRSVALAERLGARRDDDAKCPGADEGAEPCLVYRHPPASELAA